MPLTPALLSFIVLVPAPQDESAAGESHRKMVAVLDEIEAATPAENLYLGTAAVRRLRDALRRLPPLAPAAQRCDLRFRLGQAELKLGLEPEAIANLRIAYDLLPQAGRRLPAEAPALVTLALGMAYLRLGETRNCCQRNNPDSCLLPIRGGGIHTVTEPSEQAMQYFTEVLRRVRGGSTAYWKARWLLNLAAMTVGGHPDRVLRPHRIPREAFASDQDFPRFPNVGRQLGVNTFSLLGGAVADDFDGDGHLDLMVSSWDTSARLRVFRNDGKGGFEDRTDASGLEGIRGGINMVQADYDNDGDVDVLVLRGGWFFRYGRHPNSLLRNRGDGTFLDVTFDAGLGEVRLPTQTASWADYDLDGDLDLYVGNESTQSVRAPCNLFRNNGDGTFTDVAAQAGVTNDRFTKAVVWGDYDGDRYPDLYVSNYQARNRLYRNRGDGTFVDVAARLGVDEPIASFPAWFWDFDNDGNLDIYVAAYSGGIAEVCASYVGRSTGSKLARLYRGDGRGGFDDVAEAMNLKRPVLPMGCNFGDLDNDGWLDFYLGTGWPDFEELMPSVMYRNRAGKGFADVTTAGGFGNLQKGHAVAFADFDSDGDQDVFEQMGGAYPADRYYDALYENPGFGHHWIAVQLVGVESNRSAIGARIRLDTVETGTTRTIYKHVNSGGSFGANPLRQTIGLGKAERIDRLEIYWPRTDKRQHFRQVPMDRHIRIVEGRDRLEQVRRKER